MVVLSGRYKGHKLYTFPKGLPIRPMTQRVKKSVFDTITSYLNPETKVLDLFSGCGSLSFESLSRGAKQVYAVEKNKKCCLVIQKNAVKLKIIKEQLILNSMDVFQFLKNSQNIKPFGLIFADPPFCEHWCERIIKSLKTSPVCDKESLIVMEASSKETFPKAPFIALQAKKNFGDKFVYFFHLQK